MKQLFAYIRVSTAKQGQGVSLQEQRATIERYAARTGVLIVRWFEERKTAAKAGRPEFARMVKLLRAGKADGVVIHKIDRSTRNYRDWADIDELIDDGVEVRFANDDLDLRSRGGRLAADIQVAVAVDYIRNLREEALKGIHGRLKQGILPNGVGIGYLDTGAGKPKAIDPIRGPLVKRVFELYASGAYALRDVATEAKRIGLRNRNGNPLHMQEIHKVLRNPFYAGIIRSKRFGLFPGAHEPLITHALFERVQAVLSAKFVRRSKRHAFLFRRFLRCMTCGRCLIGSVAKGHVYYRCPTITCPTTSLREERIDAAVREVLAAVTLGEKEASAIAATLAAMSADAIDVRAARRATLREALAGTNARLSRLTDLLLDAKIEALEHEERRATLVAERIRLEQELAQVDGAIGDATATVRKIVELAKSAEMLYELGDAPQKRQLLEFVLSNCVVTGKNIDFSMREPFATLANRHLEQTCRQLYDTDANFSREALSSWGADWPLQLIGALEQAGALLQNST